MNKEICSNSFDEDKPSEEINFQLDWIFLEDLELKIILSTLLIQKNDEKHLWSTRELCELLDLSYHSKNTSKIFKALNSLSDNNVIEYSYDHKHSIKILYNNDNILTIDKTWLYKLINYRSISDLSKISISWVKLIKVFIYLYNECLRKDNYGYISDRIKVLHISYETFRKAYYIIKNISSLDCLVIYKRSKCICDDLGNFYQMPANFEFVYDWTKE